MPLVSVALVSVALEIFDKLLLALRIDRRRIHAIIILVLQMNEKIMQKKFSILRNLYNSERERVLLTSVGSVYIFHFCILNLVLVRKRACKWLNVKRRCFH